jgi:YegS/Rv2252/BmrU family lipid kinase
MKSNAMKKIAFLVNRTIKNLEKTVAQIESEFQKHEVKFFYSDHSRHIEVLAETAIDRGFKNLITVGGDGTLNETVNGIMNAFKKGLSNSIDSYDWDAIKEIKVGLIPAGTGNDFSKTIKLTNNINALRNLIEDDRFQSIDIGWSSFFDKKEQPVQRFFINITDVGMGGVVVESMEKSKNPFLTGNAFYKYSIAKTFLTYDKSSVRCYNEYFDWKGKVMNFVIANGKYFGSGLGIAPDANIQDGKFSIVILGDINIIDYFRYLGDVKKCKKISHPEVAYHQFEKISIESADEKPLAIDMDGEFIGYAPMTLVNLSSKLNFFMP